VHVYSETGWYLGCVDVMMTFWKKIGVVQKMRTGLVYWTVEFSSAGTCDHSHGMTNMKQWQVLVSVFITDHHLTGGRSYNIFLWVWTSLYTGEIFVSLLFDYWLVFTLGLPAFVFLFRLIWSSWCCRRHIWKM